MEWDANSSRDFVDSSRSPGHDSIQAPSGLRWSVAIFVFAVGTALVAIMLIMIHTDSGFARLDRNASLFGARHSTALSIRFGLALGWGWFALFSVSFGGYHLRFGAPAKTAAKIVTSR